MLMCTSERNKTPKKFIRKIPLGFRSFPFFFFLFPFQVHSNEVLWFCQGGAGQIEQDKGGAGWSCSAFIKAGHVLSLICNLTLPLVLVTEIQSQAPFKGFRRS